MEKNLNKLSSNKYFIPTDKRGSWKTKDSRGHHFDLSLFKTLSWFFSEYNMNTIVDFGCGTAEYVSRLKDEGIKCEAYDGNPNTPEITKGFGKTLDFSEVVDLKKRFDCVISFEVGEHIPQQYETVFIDNLIRHFDKYLILSWAVEGQLGDGHINCRNNDYIIDIMKRRNIRYIEDLSLIFREKATLPWFKNTIMVFTR